MCLFLFLRQFLVCWLSNGNDGDGCAPYHDGRAVGSVPLPASVLSGYRYATTDEILPTNIVRRAWISSSMRQQDRFSWSIPAIHIHHSAAELRLDRLSSFASWRSSIMLFQLVCSINLWWSSATSGQFLGLGEQRLIPLVHLGVLSSQFESLLCCCHCVLLCRMEVWVFALEEIMVSGLHWTCVLVFGVHILWA